MQGRPARPGQANENAGNGTASRGQILTALVAAGILVRKKEMQTLSKPVYRPLNARQKAEQKAEAEYFDELEDLLPPVDDGCGEVSKNCHRCGQPFGPKPLNPNVRSFVYWNGVWMYDDERPRLPCRTLECRLYTARLVIDCEDVMKNIEIVPLKNCPLCGSRLNEAYCKLCSHNQNRSVERHPRPLTATERKVIRLSIREFLVVGEKLNMAPRTLNHHKQNICGKLGAKDLTHAIRIILLSVMELNNRKPPDFSNSYGCDIHVE